MSTESDIDTQKEPIFCDHGARQEENCDYCNVEVLKKVEKKEKEDRFKRTFIKPPAWVDPKE